MKTAATLIAIAVTAVAAGLAHGDTHRRPADGDRPADHGGDNGRVHAQYQPQPPRPEAEHEQVDERERTQQQRDTEQGREKQREMATDRERKELGKGSQQGQEKRTEKSHKWWKFWD